MRSVRCDVCGTKALMAASKCPKCGHGFSVRDGFGDLLPLAHCSTCSSDYPLQQGSCKWCGTAPQRAAISPLVWKGAGILAFVSLGVGAFLIRDDEPPPKPIAFVTTTDSASGSLATDSTASQTSAATERSDTASSATPTSVVGDSTPVTLVSNDSIAPDSAGAITTAAQVALGNVPTADSVDAVDPAPPPIDSARLREPWLPPPSVIPRTPSPLATSSTPTAATPSAPAPEAGLRDIGARDALGRPITQPREPTPREVVPREASPRIAPPSSAPAPKVVARNTPKPPAKATKPTPTRAATRVAANRSPSARTPAGSTSRKITGPAPRTAAAAKSSKATTKAAPRATTRWLVARSWAVVRADAHRGARIVGSIGPDTHVQLSETRGGWRRIKAKGLAGWVDARAVLVRAPNPPRSRRVASQR